MTTAPRRADLNFDLINESALDPFASMVSTDSSDYIVGSLP